jgi:hypothetical protein
MGADEESTLARLKAYRRELIDPKIAEHRGRTAQMLIAASLAHLGRRDEAHDLLGRARAQSLDPRYQQMPWTRPEDNALRLEGVRLAAGEAT